MTDVSAREPLAASEMVMSRPPRPGRSAESADSASIFDLLEAQAEQRPDAVAIAAPGRVPLSYRRLCAQIRETARALSGILLGIRQQPPSIESYQLAVLPGRGGISLVRIPSGQEGVGLAGRTDLAGRLARDDWNSVAVRVQRQNLWVLLNDVLILSAADPTYDRGGVYVALRRLGNPDDEPESAVVMRNLRVSKLASGA